MRDIKISIYLSIYSYWVILYSEWSCMIGEVYRSNHALAVGVTCHNH